VATTTSSGFLTAKERYTPFGETLDNPGLLSDQGGFTGHIKDSATGLNPAFFASENCKVQARYYDPVIGRFLSVDPVTFLDKPYPGQFNRYTYTWNDPINANDPDGEFLNFVAKFVVDVGLEVALQVATGQDIDIGAATKDAAIGLLDPTKTAKKVAALGAIGGAALVARKARKTCCFVAGTLVETEFGLRPIEEIEVDDLVWARDGETGVEALKPVLGLIRLHDRVIWDLETISETGEAHTFGTTDDHPWWVDGHGWKRTDELSPKDILVTQTGEKVSILSVTNTNLVKPTFNFEVADFNTYFVGESKVWVHNAACDLKGSYVRFGDGPETIDTLTEQAGKAKAAGFGHGVSVKHTKRVSGSDNAHRSATVDDVGSNFNVRNTGNNPNHRTVDINEPVTQSDVDKFNETFPPK
jgi:RHS repeat-associated protein